MSELWNVIRGIAEATPFALIGAVMLVALIVIGTHQQMYSLNGIKTRPVGDGQHGTARWATAKEIRATYTRVPFEPEKWRRGENLPTDKQGLILGCEGPKNNVTALVDTNDIHALVTAASGAGKTAFFLYPNIEYALASGMSFLCTDTKRSRNISYIGGVTVTPPAIGAAAPDSGRTGTAPYVGIGYTEVTSDLYYSGGYLATLKIPAIAVNVKVYQGTDSNALAKGAGHFEETSIWDGRVAIAGHNRGATTRFDPLQH